jgi:hypothetical protein
VSAAVELVARHLAAVWKSDWTLLRQSMSSEPELRVSHGDWSHNEWEIGGLYRHISQAWDFRPGEVNISDEGDGIVRAKMHLTNGGEWTKDVEGEYRVRGDRIDRIRLVDSSPYRTTGGSN